MRFGGNTSCFAVEIGERLLLLDCGSGALAFRPERRFQRIDLLFSHLHLDHIIGFPFFSPLFSGECPVYIHGETRGGVAIREQLGRVFGPPWWPVGMDALPPCVHWMNFACRDTLRLGDGIVIKTMRSSHPNDCTLFRIESDGKSLVYALDFEHGASTAELVRFAAGCDLLIYDAHYTDEEYAGEQGPRGWGHSTWQEGLRAARACGAARVLLSHHHPDRTDRQIEKLERELLEYTAAYAASSPASPAADILAAFAREGQVIEL